MGHWQKIRQEASHLHQQISAKFNLGEDKLINPETLIDRALEYLFCAERNVQFREQCSSS